MTPELCVDDPAMFRVEHLDGMVTDVSLVIDQARGAVLPAGRWFTVFPDPLGGCELAMAAFNGAETDGAP